MDLCVSRSGEDMEELIDIPMDAPINSCFPRPGWNGNSSAGLCFIPSLPVEQGWMSQPGATAGTVPPPNPGYGENGDPRGRIPVVPSTQSLLPHPGAQHGAKLPEIPSSSARGFHGSAFPHFPCSQSTFPHFPHSQSTFPPFPGGWKAQTKSGISRMAPGWQQYREQRRDPKICG